MRLHHDDVVWRAYMYVAFLLLESAGEPGLKTPTVDVRSDSSAVVMSPPQQPMQPPPPPPAPVTTSTTPVATPSSTTGSTASASSSAAAAAKPAPKVATPQPDQYGAPAPQASPSSGGSVGGSGGSHWAMTYTPYAGSAGGSSRCKTSAEVASDIAGLAQKGFKTVRIYSTDDCNQLEAVHGACKAHGLTIILGVFFKDAGACESSMAGQLKVITSYFSGKYDGVELITIGNECISTGTCKANQLAGLVSSAKETLKAAGYAGPVSTALIVSDWLDNKGALCPVVDVVAAQVHPFFSDQPVAPASAGSYFESQYEQAQGACGSGKPVLCTETGWPSSGGSYKGQTAGSDQQAAAIKSLKGNKYVGKTVFFANSNDLWKTGQEEYEKYFGCADQF